MIALVVGTPETVDQILLKFAKTERNFVIDKGKTTIGNEELAVDSKILSGIIEIVQNFFKKILSASSK